MGGGCLSIVLMSCLLSFVLRPRGDTRQQALLLLLLPQLLLLDGMAAPGA